jgi:adenylate cyclase
MRFRIGVHVGDVLVQGANLLGDGVNIAARLETLAEPGGICVSGAVRDYLGKKLPVMFTDCGEQSVKNIAEPVRAYWIGSSATVPIDAAKRAPLPGERRVSSDHEQPADTREPADDRCLTNHRSPCCHSPT